ncbi:dienelactone hydrolase family protein [Terracidiphilus gabretensis]|uniref:dienelactone hydrolase family protein n=1 Tax=Terracidiphilus gabretensis TaxID=1577687 RepID=UPI00071B9472|nr:dienelactone hydrolase family protein [Terracidiphilus gabretensis]
MKAQRLLLLAFTIWILVAGINAFAQQAVTFPSGGETANGFLYLPQGSGPHPAVIVIQEYWGVNDWIKQEAAGFSSKGYVALAVDLYRGKIADTPDMAHELMRGLPQDQGVRDLAAGYTFLSARKDVKHDRIGAVGWCMGGGYAAQLAIAEPSLRAVAINYGALPTDKDALAKINAAVMGNFGGQDRGISPESVQAFATSMKSLGKPVDAKIYPDAGHAFENPGNKTGYRPEDAKDALWRIDRFFAANLQR